MTDSISGFSSGVENMYLAKVRNPEAFWHPPNVQLTSQPRFNGSVDEFLAHHGASHSADDGLRRKMKNKVKKCPKCGKPCAFVLASCNACGNDLLDVPIQFVDNVFTAFIFGIAKCPFPATISIRSQTPKYLVFDDLLALAPCHLNSIPTSVYCPDWRYLLTRPEEGLFLVDGLFEHAYQAAKSQFWDNEEWRKKFISAQGQDLTDSEIRAMVICGMNYPPSQFQLHLQFMLPPLLPFHFNLALANQHFNHGRFFPLPYIRRVLEKQAELGCKRFDVVTDDTNVEDIMSYFDNHGVIYDDVHSTCVRDYMDAQRKLARWDPADFEYLVAPATQRIMNRETWQLIEGCDASKIQGEDKLALQGYGRPYKADGKSSGTFYAFASSPEELVDWADAPALSPNIKRRKASSLSAASCRSM